VSDVRERRERIYRIWLAEDNPGDAYLLKKALKRHQLECELTWYTDGEEAIHAFSKEGSEVPDLILIDLKLPRRDGFDVVRAIKGIPSLVGVRIGVLTSSDAPTERHRIALQGVDRYIHKPPDLDEFLNTVGQAVKDLLGFPAT
jgi:CheY-like chemotaxis protein